MFLENRECARGVITGITEDLMHGMQTGRERKEGLLFHGSDDVPLGWGHYTHDTMRIEGALLSHVWWLSRKWKVKEGEQEFQTKKQ